ncbi:GntR family transcriptional regulator [Xanthobacter dioxanivorans]|uniref:GntR family transcriptional regulator n=1 Tax=Xanthobacter dioxanivorans TaxID=2528964 RepID=A0A974PK42_9HYPH|nr:GntR family transcriptional regulator [Xanthobacter dioxanivorans]QRG04669.1 GntR family transcriptional regulator [Xanthobacter dioxanivorans]
MERKLCEWLSVSRTSVREALRQLAAEGWVDNVPYIGPSVRSISPQDVTELYGIRAALEGYAAAQYCARATDADDAALSAALAEMKDAADRGAPEAQTQAIAHFYAALLAPAANPRLNASLDEQGRWLGWLRRASLSDASAARASFAEKEVLVTALLKRDTNRARTLCETHLERAAARVGKALVKRLHELSAARTDAGAA